MYRVGCPIDVSLDTISKSLIDTHDRCSQMWRKFPKIMGFSVHYDYTTLQHKSNMACIAMVKGLATLFNRSIDQCP